MNYTLFLNATKVLARNFNFWKPQQITWPIMKATYTIEDITIFITDTKSEASKSKHGEKRHYGNGGTQSESTHGFHTLNYRGSICGSLAFSFGFFGSSKNEEEETPEDKLITTIKSSMLCIQREQYDKAERILHVALRMAQDLQSQEGITYVYDVMANLAMEQKQFNKAEKLFAEVMKRLFANGYSEDSPQIMHISAKLAHMAQLQGELEKALQGFTWTIKKIGEHIRQVPEDKDIQELLGLTKNWFGQLQMKQGKYSDAKASFQEAYSCLVKIYGHVNEEAVTILNNLSVACVNLDEFQDAKEYLQQALDLARELKDSTQEGILLANMGLIYLREGLVAQAKEACTLAYRIGKKSKNPDAIEQAEYCLEEIKTTTQ